MPFYYYNGALYSSEELMHYGVPGMKWGVRKYLDSNGHLTNRGQRRYNTKNYTRGLNRLQNDIAQTRYRAAKNRIKLEKATKRGRAKKIEKYSARQQSLESSIKSGEKTTKRILAKAAKNGVKLRSEKFTSLQSDGARMLNYTMLNPKALNKRAEMNRAFIQVQNRRTAVDMYRHGPEAAGFVETTRYKRAKK